MEQTGETCYQPLKTGPNAWEEVVFQNTPALFTPLRINKADIPENLCRYEIRAEDGIPCQLAKSILVDHYGTLLV